MQSKYGSEQNCGSNSRCAFVGALPQELSRSRGWDPRGSPSFFFWYLQLVRAASFVVILSVSELDSRGLREALMWASIMISCQIIVLQSNVQGILFSFLSATGYGCHPLFRDARFIVSSFATEHSTYLERGEYMC